MTKALRDELKPARIGIYAGAFNPVHVGHITFALQALQAGKLDAVYFMPERRPRLKLGVEHFAHRVAMIRRACAPHAAFEVLELVDVSFSVQRTLPKLQKQFAGSELVFLMGSDALDGLQDWPHVASLLASSELIIGVRAGDSQPSLEQQISSWELQPRAVTLFESFAGSVSSSQIREGLRKRQPVAGLLQSVAHYSNRHWLYVSFK